MSNPLNKTLRRFLKRSLTRLAQYATDPGDNEEWRLKKSIGVVTVLSGFLVYLGYGALYLPFGEYAAAWVSFGAAAALAAELVSYQFWRDYGKHAHIWLATHALGVIAVHFLLGGFAPSGMAIIWLLIMPIETIVAHKPRHGIHWFLFVAATFTIAAFLQPYLRPANNLPPGVIITLYAINALGAGAYMLLAVYYYVWRNSILSGLLSSEQEKAEALLLNILPKEIADILKNENRVIANQFDNASILFADLVNFTPMSAGMTPTEIVEILNDVFSRFDTLVEKYGLEKIKTIGDCYMVAAGVPRRRPDHALALTQLALDIRDYVNQHEFHGQRLSFRIGINSGSVVAGVIGRKKFIYDLWGDAVNTASRMESQGAGGFIQITEATYALIKDDFVCEARGSVKVKGKGEMNVWYVLEKKD
jgi:guanylate cyclase